MWDRNERINVVSTVVLDTNIFIAAAFNQGSHSACIIEAVRERQLRLRWNEQTRRETKHLLRKIPRLSWEEFCGLFQEKDRYQGETDPEQFSFVADWEDRKFAALAEAAGATLVTQDQDLLSVRSLTHMSILTPREFVKQILKMSPLEN